MKHMSMRLSEEQINFLMQQAQDNGATFSEQLRAGLDAYINLCMKIKDGNFICTFKTPSKQDFYELMHELESLMLENEGMVFNEYLPSLISALQFEYGMKATQKIPNELVQLNGCRQYIQDEDWT